MVDVWCWKRYDQNGSLFSVPRYLEDHAESLRCKYLTFIHDLGEALIGDRRLIDHLDIGNGRSFWWLTLLAEKSPFKSSRIYDCLLLLALEEILDERKPRRLELRTNDCALAEAVQALCRQTDINFVRRTTSRRRRRLSVRRIYKLLPHPLKALISLRHVVYRWRLRRVAASRWHEGADSVFLCSYFIHLDPVRCRAGQFHSRQWEVLPDLLHDRGLRTNWIHHFLVSPAVPDTRTGVEWVERFSREADEEGVHTFLESYLSWGVVLRALRTWLKLTFVSIRVRGVQTAFRPKTSAVWLWPLLREDWRASVRGVVCLVGALQTELFEAALKELPHQEIGLYLCENQAWEKGLLWAWRKGGHGVLIGVAHATVPYWHLCYFDDPRTLRSSDPCALPLPDRVAVNGPAALRAYLTAGYPAERVSEVEALRYLGLAGVEPRRSTRAPALRARLGGPPRRVLILGGIDPAAMDRMLGSLETSLRNARIRLLLTLKSHPSNPMRPDDYPGLGLEVTHEPVAEILNRFDIALAHHSTSAALDAHQGGLPVVVFLQGDSFNLSPLRGVRGVTFVGTADEMSSALQASTLENTEPAVDEFFWLDPKLPRWKRLLGFPA